MTPSGWPQLVLFCIGKDLWGNDFVKAYGSAVIPIEPGMHKKVIKMYSPVQQGSIWEYFGYNVESDSLTSLLDNPKAIANPSGREVSRVMSTGKVDIQFHVTQKGLGRHGYFVDSGSKGKF